MKWEKKHTFGQEEAQARIKALTDYWTSKANLNCTWTGPEARIAGKVKGIKFDATLRITDDTVFANVKANFLAEKIGRAYVEGKVDHYLNPANSLDSLTAK